MVASKGQMFRPKWREKTTKHKMKVIKHTNINKVNLPTSGMNNFECRQIVGKK